VRATGAKPRAAAGCGAPAAEWCGSEAMLAAATPPGWLGGKMRGTTSVAAGVICAPNRVRLQAQSFGAVLRRRNAAERGGSDATAATPLPPPRWLDSEALLRRRSSARSDYACSHVQTSDCSCKHADARVHDAHNPFRSVAH